MIRITINGIAGRMGRELSLALENSSKFDLIGGIDLDLTKNVKHILVTTKPSDLLPNTDVVVDFSLPEGTMNILSACVKYKKPLVTGTTGLNSNQLESFKKAAETIPIVQAFNFSIGINLLIHLVRKSSEILSENFDIEIIEKHHRNKLDAPSGTAMLLAKTISEYSRKSFPEVLQYGRKGTNLIREKEIGIHSLRGGSVIGDHEVLFLGQNENLVLSHNALNRKIFVNGALSAVEWIPQKQNGLFGMKEVLGF